MGIYWDNGKENGNPGSLLKGYIGVYLGCFIGIMEKKMETTIQGLGFRVIAYEFRVYIGLRVIGL